MIYINSGLITLGMIFISLGLLNHSEHVANLVKAIFDDLPARLKKNLSKSDLVEAALLHDIGKIMTPLTILNKKMEKKLVKSGFNINCDDYYKILVK